VSQLTFPVVKDGLTVPVLIGLDGPSTAHLVAAGQLVPGPALVRGLIDTGTDVTCIVPALRSRLGLALAGTSNTQTVGGQLTVNLYRASLSITDTAVAGAPMMTHPNLLVMETTAQISGFDVLIGLDVILECRLTIDGPARTFTLDF
jgi:hypothetical protein